MDTDDPGPPASADEGRYWPMNVVLALLASPKLADELARALLFELVGSVPDEPPKASDPPASRMREFLGLVRHCEKQPHGLPDLVSAVEQIEGASWTSHIVGELVRKRMAQIPAVNGSAAPERTEDDPRRDFFVSYTAADRSWATWISWRLEEAGYSVLVQEWDFVPGTNWQFYMDKGVTQCERTIAVLSPAYLNSVYGRLEWQVAQSDDPTGLARRLVPVMVERCTPQGLLGSVVYIDLTPAVADDEARRRLLGGIGGARTGRSKPTEPPPFPRSGEPR
ncbi:toll/interleukin-1 receptor domain-containing protein [Streptomyces sp. NPDC047081]|uniref:toll/interleukin-1 receptor domain-containing protein n=1 Tax=Streptomyces sp. NPDC047081 TaxID=3154706 RepID=UPI003408A715